jgi:broad specificity phosphatase PhoE
LTSRLVIVRHGTTAFNSEQGERFRAWIDIPLTEEGMQQSQAIAKTLSAYRFDRIFSSDLQRALVTATMIQRAQGPGAPPVQPTQALRPWHLGELAGKPVEGEHLDRMIHHQMNDRHVAVPGGESFNQFVERFVGFLAQRMKEARTQGLTECLVSHTRNQRVMDGLVKTGMKGIDKKTLASKDHMEPASAQEFSYDGKKWKLTQEINP